MISVVNKKTFKDHDQQVVIDHDQDHRSRDQDQDLRLKIKTKTKPKTNTIGRIVTDFKIIVLFWVTII